LPQQPAPSYRERKKEKDESSDAVDGFTCAKRDGSIDYNQIGIEIVVEVDGSGLKRQNKLQHRDNASSKNTVQTLTAIILILS